MNMEAKRNISSYCFYGLIFTIALNCAFPVCGQQSLPGMLKPEGYLPVFRSNDWVYWQSRKPAEYYVVNQTPLKTLPGYDTLYPKGGSTLVPYEKSYAVTWEIVDDQLYLCDIEFDILIKGWGQSGIIENKDRQAMYKKMEDKVYPDGKKYRIMEQFVGAKFQKNRVRTAWPPKPQGVIPAVWVDGTFLLKKNIDTDTIPDDSEPDPSNMGIRAEVTRAFDNAPTFKVTFSKGRIVSAVPQ